MFITVCIKGWKNVSFRDFATLKKRSFVKSYCRSFIYCTSYSFTHRINSIIAGSLSKQMSFCKCHPYAFPSNRLLSVSNNWYDLHQYHFRLKVELLEEFLKFLNRLKALSKRWSRWTLEMNSRTSSIILSSSYNAQTPMRALYPSGVSALMALGFRFKYWFTPLTKSLLNYDTIE